jgi:hypothetical protein
MIRTPIKKNTPFKHNFSSGEPNWTCKGLLKRSQRLDDFQLGNDGHLRLWPTPQSGQNSDFPKQGMMELYRSEILY